MENMMTASLLLQNLGVPFTRSPANPLFPGMAGLDFYAEQAALRDVLMPVSVRFGPALYGVHPEDPVPDLIGAHVPPVVEELDEADDVPVEGLELPGVFAKYENQSPWYGEWQW